MTRFFIIIFFIHLANSFLSQTKVDTLVLATNKYCLVKTKLFHSSSQTGPVDLPSEYKDDKNLPFLMFKYKAVNDSSYEVKLEEELGGEYTVLKPEPKNIYPYWDNHSHLSSLTDTIYLTSKEFRNLRPYIKSNGKKIFFCASKVDKIYNDTITIASHSYVKDGTILSFWQPYTEFSENDIKKLQQTTFIIRELHYTRGSATFYLNRKFVLKIK
jgi:hypothetical protein